MSAVIVAAGRSVLEHPADAGAEKMLRVPRLAGAHDRVRVFRRCLEVLAEPGEVRDLAGSFTERDVPGADAGCAVVAAPLLVLADLLTPIGAPPGDDAALADLRLVAEFTHAPVVALERARFVLAERPPSGAEILSMRRGTSAEPHHAALLVLGVGTVGSGSQSLRLSGPGVDGRRELALDGLPVEVCHARAEAIDFPHGIDMLLVDRRGRVAGLPRTTRVEVLT